VTYIAGQHLFPDRVPGWYVHTTDSMIVAGPFSDVSAAQLAGTRIAMRMAERMRRDGGACRAADVRARVDRLRVGYGLRPASDGRFHPATQEVDA
jgi:hypothetical protein